MLRSCKPRWTVAFPQAFDAVSRDVEQAFDQLVNNASQFVRPFAAPVRTRQEAAWIVKLDFHLEYEGQIPIAPGVDRWKETSGN